MRETKPRKAKYGFSGSLNLKDVVLFGRLIEKYGDQTLATFEFRASLGNVDMLVYTDHDDVAENIRSMTHLSTTK